MPKKTALASAPTPRAATLLCTAGRGMTPIPDALSRAPRAALHALALGLVLASACHDDVAGPRDAAVDDAAFDPDAAVAIDTSAPLDTATSLDTFEAPDAADASPLEDTTPLPGELGAPCVSGADCNSSWCIGGREGLVCSRACTESCPLGWSCRQNVAALPDVAFICMPPMPTLCRPCDTNADCVPSYDTTPHACVRRGDEGAFCGGLCASDHDCPDDYFCATVLDVAGNATRQCTPDAGVCTCSASAIAEGASTTCGVTNPFGSCPGARACGPGGLSACDAPTPAADLCDGVDDNCDGRTDEAFTPAPCSADNAFGSCPGITACEAGAPRCVAPEPAAERCGDGVDNDCDGRTDDEGAEGCVARYFDGDADGVGVGEGRCLCAPDGFYTATTAGDCDDTARRVHPGADERCNGIDDDCDGDTDEAGAVGCLDFYADRDGDGFGDPAAVACLCGPEAPWTSRDGLDCDDDDGEVNPARSEVCDGVDTDCDGETDEEGAVGCVLFFEDADGDGFGDPASFRCLCAAAAPFTAEVGGDCDDAADGGADRSPGLPEVCDGVDNDCDGVVDEPGAEGCVVYYRDADGDGFGLAGDWRCLCGPDEELGYTALAAGDCNDAEELAYPGAVEVCDGVDNDCDGVVDEEDAEGCEVYYADRDRDGFGVDEGRCLCQPVIPYTAAGTDDCDDANPFIHPDGVEVCNGRDDDCDGATDEGVTGQCSPFYRDADHDGWGDADDAQCLCAPSGEYTSTKPGDCDDSRADIYPLAQELCNGVDDDCDGATDEADALGCDVYYLDADRDGVGLATASRCLCAADPEAFYDATAAGDCDDGDADVFPGALEVCNGVDDDCDGAVDEPGADGCSPFMRDSDGDTWGVAQDTLCLCEPTGAYRATRGGDCDDGVAAINPGAEEVCDGVDNDCNGIADDPDLPECVVYYRDVDGDTFGRDGESACLCGPVGTLTATRGGDCDDLLAAVNPDAVERCNDVDDDCDGATDEADAVGCAPLLRDGDGDGFGVTGDARCLCQPEGAYQAVVGGDCDDDDADVNPGQVEVCNGKDDTCDGATDGDGASGCVVRWRDGDRDGYGDALAQRCLCDAAAPWDATGAGDCDDTDAAIKPGATEVCDGVDNDCDGFVDEIGAEGCEDLYLDADGDGYGVASHALCLCSAQGAYSATIAGDCDDGDPLRSPGRAEACSGVDDDCDGDTDEPGALGCTARWLDVDGDTWGVDGSEVCLCAPIDDFTAIRGGDCDDGRAAVHPAATEVCDSLDNDCDGVVDAGCGLPTLGWPTFMQNNRRTGHTIPLQGPTTAALRWTRALGDAPFANSPVIDPAGDVIVLLGDTVTKLSASDGATVWATTVPAAAHPRASPTVRVGGTVVVPAGHGVVLLGVDGATIWDTDFGGGPGDRVVGSPLVDPTGQIYVISNTHARRLDARGVVVWEVAIDNTPDHPSDPALGPDGRLYFATASAVYAMTPGGVVNWTWSVAGKPPGASVTITEVARILVPAGDTLYLLADGLDQALVNTTRSFGGALLRVNAALYSDGWQCCNPREFPLASPEGSDGLRMLSSTMGARWSVAHPRSTGPTATPVFDRDGDIYVGSNATSPDGNAVFYARRESNGSVIWSRAVAGSDIDGAAAIGAGFVVFGDSSGAITCVGN